MHVVYLWALDKVLDFKLISDEFLRCLSIFNGIFDSYKKYRKDNKLCLLVRIWMRKLRCSEALIEGDWIGMDLKLNIINFCDV